MMRFGIISDIHFPKEITWTTYLYTQYGYANAFYSNLKKDIQHLRPEEIDAFIVCGDFIWDYYYFDVPSQTWPFNLIIDLLQEFREWLEPSIPLIFTKGNHDFWFNTFITSEKGILLFDEQKYADYLFDVYHLIEDQVERITEELDAFGEVLELGENIFLLENNGILIKDCYIYGFPYYDKKRLSVPWSKYKEYLIHRYNQDLERLQKQKSISTPVKTILCHHRHPPSKNFVQSFNNENCEIKGFYWGHYHEMKVELYESLLNYDSYVCVMPEKNNYRILTFEV